ncbi:hypothetical protein TELCIR_05249 [Teladorsagia circumcincta]|uniref:Uncharacterized protein n=1 Tax=Teladorsagia circumcincta TaxID=45464 RepID=A0A2G9URL9_TELCI|nr:hypothetical protein TELCIR_05249 [Teladorsagia circumcincta]
MKDGSQTRSGDDGDRDYFWLIFFILAAVALILIVCVIPILILLATTKYSKMKKGAKTKRNSKMRPKHGAPMKPGKKAAPSKSNSKSALMQSNSKSQSSGQMKKGKKFQ